MAENPPISDIGHGKKAITAEIKRIAFLDLKQCQQSREEVALAISGLVGREITVSQIDAFVADSKPHRFPLDMVAAWASVTGSRKLLDLACSAAGFYLADETEHHLAQYGRAVLERKRLEAREADLSLSLQERI